MNNELDHDTVELIERWLGNIEIHEERIGFCGIGTYIMSLIHNEPEKILRFFRLKLLSDHGITCVPCTDVAIYVLEKLKNFDEKETEEKWSLVEGTIRLTKQSLKW